MGNMAKSSLRSDSRLQGFLLPSVRPTGRSLGTGSFGTVEELEVEGLVCAGKKLHELLVKPEYAGKQHMVERFVEECALLARLRHPLIVQFLGICFLEDSDLPVLVMEYLPYSLNSLLENKLNDRGELPLSMKYSILCNIALGLTYLHAYSPPVIHRDLTANNVLLTSAMVAKIVDLGVARVLDIHPGQQLATMTRAPGTPAYMPPEALEERPKYDAAIDMFSFGNLALFTIAEIIPIPGPATRPDPSNSGSVIGLSEVQRRPRPMTKLTQQLGGEKHPLVQMVTQCLHNDPSQRPSAKEALSQLESLRDQIQDPYKSMSRLELIQALKRRGQGQGKGVDMEAELLQSQSRVREIERQLQTKEGELDRVQGELQSRIDELEGSLSEAKFNVQHYQSRVERMEGQLRSKEAEMEASRDEVQQLQSRLQDIQGQLEAKEEECQSRLQLVEAELQTKGSKEATAESQQQHTEARLRADTDEGEPTNSTKQGGLSFNWSKPQSMPVKTAAAQAVVLHGKVYVSIGKADLEEDQQIIQVYTTKTQQWSQLLKCPIRFSAMAAVDHQLVVVAYDELLVWDGDWTFPYPSLPTPRDDPVAIGYQQFLVVAAGRKEESSLKVVEILNSSSKRWSTSSPLPVECHGLTSALVGNTLYLLGGWSGYVPNRQVFSASLRALVSHATANPKATTWNQVAETPLKHCTSTSVYSSLLAVGGEDEDYLHSSAIFRYDPQLKKWTQVGEMPEALSQCACVALPSGDLMVIGGTNSEHRHSDRVHLATISS